MPTGSENRGVPRQLLAYVFPPGADFEGRLMGALQRVESGGALRVLEALFVGRDEAGELVAVSLASASSAGMIGKLIGFRLDDSARRKQTEAAREGARGELVQAIADALEPGGAVAAVMVEHAWAGVLAEAVDRIGGTQLANEFTDAADAEDRWTALPGRLAAGADARA